MDWCFSGGMVGKLHDTNHLNGGREQKLFFPLQKTGKSPK